MDSMDLILIVQPTEIYNPATSGHLAVSFKTLEYTANVDAIGTLRLLEPIRILGMEKITRFYQAPTSELYSLVQTAPGAELWAILEGASHRMSAEDVCAPTDAIAYDVLCRLAMRACRNESATVPSQQSLLLRSEARIFGFEEANVA